ncbi:MAG TPA: hypothetical protein VII13_12055 [Vicinamibacteria bacterium]|jgi:hypothetical protein
MAQAGSAPRVASWASLAGVGALLLPKCPVCFAAYGGGLAAIGLGPAAPRLLEPLLALAVLSSFGIVAVLSARRRDLVTPLVSAAGAVLVLVGALALRRPGLGAVGAVLLMGASVLNAVRCRRAAAPAAG